MRDRVVPVRDNNGEILYLDAIIEDITERRRLSEAVRRAKEFAENIIDSSVDGILAFRPGLPLHHLEPRDGG